MENQKQLDYKAIVTIHNLNHMNPQEFRKLRDWLMNIASQLSYLDKDKFSKKYTLRLMK